MEVDPILRPDESQGEMPGAAVRPAPPPAPEPEAAPDLRAALEAERAAGQALREQLTAAAERYRTALLASAPDVPPELVNGETPTEIDASFEAARATVAAVMA